MTMNKFRWLEKFWLRSFSFRDAAEKAARAEIEADKHMLLSEIRNAHHDWEIAHSHLEWALETDSIDYSIYALEAAEKRYEMLLKLAKRKEWTYDPSLLEKRR
jgi:hypothetical protein